MKASKVVWAGRIISILVSVFFAFNALMKMFPQVFYPQMVEQMAGIGLPATILPIIASLELMCVIIYLIPMTSILGAILFTGYLGGAILAHLRAGEGEKFYIHLIFGGLIWLGIYLREPRLRSLIPLRKNA